MSEDFAFWLSYLTNGKHLTWYASCQFTIFAALFGGTLAVISGLVGATLKNSRFLVLLLIGSTYSSIVRVVPDVLFFLFFPLAFVQGVEWLIATEVCSPYAIASQAAAGPPCRDATCFILTSEYPLLDSVSLGHVYGAFAHKVVRDLMRIVPAGQLAAARAYETGSRDLLW